MVTAPERIFGWQLTQLSTARHFGGCKVHGAHYKIDYAADGQPLVRADVLLAEARAKREALAQRRRDEAASADQAQGGLF